MTGFTFPGMMDEPGCVSGSRSRPMPQRGPDPSHRMSLAIFMKLTAIVRKAPLASTSESCARLCFEVVFGLHEIDIRFLSR